MKYFKDNGITKFFAYKEKPRDKKVVEFGWIPVRFLSSSKSFVISRSAEQSEDDNAATLDDYREYFTKLNGVTPNVFIDKWDSDLEGLSKSWYQKMPHTESGTHEFMLKLAHLIVNKKSFEHNFLKRLTSFEVVEIENAESTTQAGNKD